MKVSFVLPIYNVLPYLERCVQSLLCQTYKDFEIILVDDGSPDGCGKLCDELATRDERIRVIHQENKGLSGARNTGIDNAKGEYIIFVDSDDLWLLDDGLETVMKQCDKGTDMICFKAVDIWTNGRKSIGRDYDLEAIARQPNVQALFEYVIRNQTLRLTAWLVVVRRQILIDHDIFFPSRRIGEDFFWHMHLWQYLNNVKMVNVNLYGYWHRQGSITTAAVSLRPYHDYDKTFTYWEEQQRQGCVNGDIILGHMANIWINRGYQFYRLTPADKPVALDILRKHTDLLNYAITPKAKRTALLLRYFGLRTTVFLLSVYWRLRIRVKGNTI